MDVTNGLSAQSSYKVLHYTVDPPLLNPRSEKALLHSTPKRSCISGDCPPTTMLDRYTGSKISDSRAPCIPRKVQAAILSLHDMEDDGDESARPGLVRRAPRAA